MRFLFFQRNKANPYFPFLPTRRISTAVTVAAPAAAPAVATPAPAVETPAVIPAPAAPVAEAIPAPVEAPPAPMEEVMPTIPAPGNNKGANKLVRLAAIGITQADIGYTDSAADLPMLSICAKAVLVNPKESLIRQVPGAEVLTPPRGLRPLPFTRGCLLGI